MMSDDRRRRRSPESSRRSRRKARRDEREHPETTLYSYPSQSQETPLPPPITMRSTEDVRASSTTTVPGAMPMSVPIPSDLNRPQRRRRSRHGSGSTSDFTYSSSGSSSSYLDISRWYPSYGRAGGVLNAFFKTPSEHRPRRRRSKRQVKKKKTKAIFGFGNNSSSSSVNSDMAYGMGFIKKPKSRGGEFSPGYNTATAATAMGAAAVGAAALAMGAESSTSRPGMQRRQTDEEILEIGRKLAQVAREQNQEDLRRQGKRPPSQLADAMNTWDRYRQSTGEQSTMVGGGRGIASSRSDRHHGYSSDDESEWESASEDESDSSYVASELAYGFHSSTPQPSTSRPTTVLERKSSVVDPRLFGPVNSLRDFVDTPCGYDDNRRAYPPAGSGQERYTGSAGTAESASAEVRPLQTVYPIGTSDPAKMDAARDSGSLITINQNNYSNVNTHDYYSTVSAPNDHPEPVPIQAPKPIAPVPSRLYDEQRAHEPERSDSQDYRRRSRSDRSRSRDRRHQTDDYEAGRSDSRERRRKPGDSKIFAETALVGAGVAALGAAMMARRDKDKGKEPDESYGRDERYGHDDHRQDDTKVEDSRRAKELALEKEIDRLEKVLAGRNKAREARKRDSKRSSAPADLGEDYERDRESKRSERSSRSGNTEEDVRPESSKRVSDPKEPAAIVHDTSYHRAGGSRKSDPMGKVDVFQYQVSDDAFQTGTTMEAPQPVIIDVTPAPSPAPKRNRKSRRDSFEEEMRDARHIVEEASHSTAPIPKAEMAAAIAATEHSRHQEELESDDRGRSSSRIEKDRVQEEANRYYHARRIAEREIRSRSRSSSTDEGDGLPRIVTPPEMKERPKVYDYSKPNADIIFDNHFSPTEMLSFFPKQKFVRDPSAERPRPFLNLVLPTPVPTPSPEKTEQRKEPAPRASEVVDDESASEGPTIVIGPKGDIIQVVDVSESRDEVPQPQTPKSVTWGPSETKQYEVESRETSRERTPESPDRTSRSSKKGSGGWGTIAAALAGAGAGAAIASRDDKRSEGSRSPPKERPVLPAGTSSRIYEEEPEELPPMPGPKPASPRSSQMPGAFADDLEFTANVAAGLEHAGFPSDIVVEDPNFRRRDSPPGSNEPFENAYSQPFSETVSDLGIYEGSRSGRESGYVLGEVADTPASENAAAFEESPKLSKKEQRKLEKAAKAAKLAEEEQQSSRPIEVDDDEWADTSSKRSKKAKKSKRSSVTWDDEDTPVNNTRSSMSIETFDDYSATKSSNNDDEWNVPKKSKKSKRNSKSYEPSSDDSLERKERRREAYEALEGDATSVVSESGHNKRSNGHGRDDDRSVVSAPSSSDRRQDSKSDKRNSGPGFWGLLKGSTGTDTDNKKESKKDDAGTLGAGAGLAGAAVVATALAGGMAAEHSDAAEAPSEQEEPRVGRDVEQPVPGWTDSSGRGADIFEDPEIVPRVFKPAIDPQYGDLLPLPPSPGQESAVDFAYEEELPALPDSRPSTPPPARERALPRGRSVSGQKRPGLSTTGHLRRLSNYEAPPRSPSHTAIPIQFRMGQRPASIISPAPARPAGSGSPAIGRSSPTPGSPVTLSGQDVSPPLKRSPRPTSWDNSKEYKPLYLLEQASRSSREMDGSLDESPELTSLPPSRESPASERESKTPQQEIVSQFADNPLYIDTEATRAVPLGSQESTPKLRPAAEHSLPSSAANVGSTHFENPFGEPFGVPSAGSFSESIYATPTESPTHVTPRSPVSGRSELEVPADVPDNKSQDREMSVQDLSGSQEALLEEPLSQESQEPPQKKGYFSAVSSILPAATLAGVGALLSRGNRDEHVTEPADHTPSADTNKKHEDLPAAADQMSVESTWETKLDDQGGVIEQGPAGARQPPVDTTYSNTTTDIADASMPNDPAAAAPTRPEEPLPLAQSPRPSDAAAHDVNNGTDSQSSADVLLSSSQPPVTETDQKTTTTTEPEQITKDMETIIETPADTVDWPMDNVPHAATDLGVIASTPTNVQEDVDAPEAKMPKATDEHMPGTGNSVPDTQGFEGISEPSNLPGVTEEQPFSHSAEGFEASTETPASPTMQDDQGVIAGSGTPKSLSGRRLRSSRVTSPHGSLDEYMSSDAVQSGEDAPMSPSSGLRTTGKKYKKTRSLRSSRRSSMASQGSGQGDVVAAQPAEQLTQQDLSEIAASLPLAEKSRDALEEPAASSTDVIDRPSDAQMEGVDRFLTKDVENAEEPVGRDAEPGLASLQAGAEAEAQTSGPSVLDAEIKQSSQPAEVVAESVSPHEIQAEDEWAPISSKKSKKSKKKNRSQSSINLVDDSRDTPGPEAEAEKVLDAPESNMPQESMLGTPGEYESAHDLIAEESIEAQNSQSQVELEVVTADSLDSEKSAKDDLLPPPQSDDVSAAEKNTAAPLNISESQETPRSLENEAAHAEDKSEEQLTIQSIVDESPITVSEDVPATQESEAELTAVSLEEEFPVVSSKKSKKNKKKRKGNTVLDETVQSSGTATRADLEQAGQNIELQEAPRSPPPEKNVLPASENLENFTAAKDEFQPVESVEIPEPLVETSNFHEQIEPKETTETKDFPQESALAPQSIEIKDVKAGTESPELVTDQPAALVTSVPTEFDTVEKDLRQEPGSEPQLADPVAEPTSLDLVSNQVETTEASKIVESQVAEDAMTQPLEQTEAVVETGPVEKVEEPEPPAQEEPLRTIDDEDALRRKAEAAQAEEEEAEIVRLQGKKKLKSKEKQRLRELKAKSEARAVEAEVGAEAIARAEAVEKEYSTEAEAAQTPSNEGELSLESSRKADDIVETSVAPDAVVDKSVEIALESAPEETIPATPEQVPAVNQDVLATEDLAPQQPDPVSEPLLQDANMPSQEKKAEVASVSESPIETAEDPEEIARREAETETIREEESELARLENKKKLNKKDKQRIKVLRASAELRDREAEALRREIEEQEAAAATAKEISGGPPAERKTESDEQPPAHEISEAVSVDDISPARVEDSVKADAEKPVLDQNEEQLHKELEIAGQENIHAPADTQLEKKVTVYSEDTTEEAVLDHNNNQAAETSVDASHTAVEEMTPVRESTTGDVDDRSLDNQIGGDISQNVAVEEVTGPPRPTLEQDQSSLPIDQPDVVESTTQEKRELETFQDNASKPQHVQPIALPEYQFGEVCGQEDKPQTEIVAESKDLSPAKIDEGANPFERDIEPLAEETVESKFNEVDEPPFETPSEEPAPEPLSEAIMASDMQNKQQPVETLEEAPALDAAPSGLKVEPEPDPIFTTKKSKKDKKKKKGSISETSRRTSGIATPAETSEPAAADDVLPANEAEPQPTADEATILAEKETAPSQQPESTFSEQPELAALPVTSVEEPLFSQADESVTDVPKPPLPLSEDQPAQIPAAVEDEALRTPASEATQEISPQEPEFTLTRKKSKKDKKKKRKGTISESSPEASGFVTPADIKDVQEESTPEVLERSEEPASTIKPEAVPPVSVDVPEQEAVATKEEPSALLGETEAVAAAVMSKEPKFEGLREEFGSGHPEAPAHAVDMSSTQTHEQLETTAQVPENVTLDETKDLGTERVTSSTVLEELDPAVPSTVTEPEAVEASEDVTEQAKDLSADPVPKTEPSLSVVSQPEKVEADEFFVVPTKKSKKDKKKKRASPVWSEPDSGPQTAVAVESASVFEEPDSVVEEQIHPMSTNITEATADVQEPPIATSNLPQDEPAKDEDWTPTTSSKKSKKDKKKKKNSISMWEPESGAQTPVSEEPRELQDAPEPTVETAENDADVVTQPSGTLAYEPETSSPMEVTNVHDTTALPATAEGSSDTPSQILTSSAQSELSAKKSSGGWGFLAAALAGEDSEPKEISQPEQPERPLEAEKETVAPPAENLTIDDSPTPCETRKEEPDREVKSFDKPKSPATTGFGGWGTIAAAVAGVTAGATALSEDKSKREASPQRTLEDVTSPSLPIAKPDLENKVIDGDEILIVASGERPITLDDTVTAPISTPEDSKVEGGDDTFVVAGGNGLQEDIEPWSFEATRDVKEESLSKPNLDENIKDGDDTLIIADGQILEASAEEPQIEDSNEPVTEQANDLLDVDQPAIRPSSPVPWEDEDRMDEFATPAERAPILDEAEAPPIPTPQEPEPEPLEFVSGKKSKKDKKKKKRGSASQSQDFGSEVPTPVTETPRFEEALEQQLPSTAAAIQDIIEPTDSGETEPVEAKAEDPDWTPKKMTKKEKRKAKKNSLSTWEPEPVAVTPDHRQPNTELLTSPQDVSESQHRDILVGEARENFPLTEEPEVIAEPANEKERSLGAEVPLTEQPEPAEEKQSEDATVKSPLEAAASPSQEPESAAQDEPVSEAAPVLTRKMSKKEKRKAKKKATSSWEDDLEPSEPTATVIEDTQPLEDSHPAEQLNPTPDAIMGTSSPTATAQPAETELGEPAAPAAEEIVAEDEWATLSRKKSKKDKKKGKQRASEQVSGSQTPVTQEQPMPTFAATFVASPAEPPVPEIVESREEDQRQSSEEPVEPAPSNAEQDNIELLAKQEQPQPSRGTVTDDWEEETPERSEPPQVALGSPAALGAELQKLRSAGPSPDIWDDEDYFMPKSPNASRDSPSGKSIEKVDIHPAFSRELKSGPEDRSKDERPFVGLGLIHRHSSIFQEDEGRNPKLLTLGAENFSVESLAVESPDDFSQTGLSKADGKKPEPRSSRNLFELRATPAPEDNGDSYYIKTSVSPDSNSFAVQYAHVPEADDRRLVEIDSFASRSPKPPPSPGLDDVNQMSKKGSVAALAERFGGTKKASGKRKKVSKYVDKRTPQEDLFDEPAMWEGSERKPIEGSRLDLDAGDFWAVPDDTGLGESSAEVEPDTFVGQGATTSYGQETKAGDDNVSSSSHTPKSQRAGEFTPQVPEQASRAEEVPVESLVVESPILGSQASFESSPRLEQTAIEPLDRPPDIDTGQAADVPTITTELTPDDARRERNELPTPQSLSPASDRGVRLDRANSPSAEADDYAAQQGISPVSDFRRSVSRGLPPVQEEPPEEEGAVGKHSTMLGTGARTPDVNRDSGFVTGSPHLAPNRHFDDLQQQRDSGVHLRDYANRVSQSSVESEGARLDDKPRRSPLAESAPILEAQGATTVTPEPQKGQSGSRRSRKQYPDLGPESAAASLAGGAALLTGTTSSRNASDSSQRSNTGISRARTPEPLHMRPESPSLLRYSGTPPLRSRRTRSGDLRSLSQLSNRSHSDVSALLQASPSPATATATASGAVDPPANAATTTPGPASSSSSSDLRRPTTSASSSAISNSNSNSNSNKKSHTPLANEGRVRTKDMADVYDGFGEGRLGSPRSPTRPHSMRRRQSMQVLELESRVEQLIAENRALAEARLHAEQHSTNKATSTIADRDNEIESLKQSLDFMRKEIQRLTEVNEGLNSAIAQSAVQHEDRYRILETQHADATRELHAFRGRHSSSSRTLEEKDAEIRDLREQLENTKEQIRDMQRQILASKPADTDFLRIKDVDYFDHRCQQLCSHVQQWVLRFSKFSDMRACRLTSELNDEKIIDRLDNAVLDGSNVDNYLNDRVRRRDIFMSLAMTMIWEFVFTRYLFGMDREQRQKLKALEKLLLEVGPAHAVRQWRAVTLTLLSRRDSFKAQRDQDTEAVVQAVFQTLSMILPPPSNLEDQIQNQLRKVMREAVDLSIEMRTQRAEYMMLPPLQPEYDANGDLAEPHPFNATLMNERSGDKSIDNDDLQAQGSIVRVVLFPLVVKKGDDDGVGDDEVVVCPAQVIVARPRSSSRRSMRAPSSDAGGVSLLRGGSPSTAPNRSNVSMAEAEYFEGGI